MARRIWKDRVVEKPRTFTIQNNPDGTVTLIPAPGAIVEAGTPVNAANLNGLEEDLVTHMEDNANPHGVTKSDVGLGSVPNYGVATKAEAEMGIVDNKLMTPLRVADAMYNATSFTNLDDATFVELTSSGTWTKPLGAKHIYVELWGAGGGGGGARGISSSNSYYGGTGGAGGGMVSYLFSSSDLASNINYIIGAGGSGGTDSNKGSSGGSTIFDTSKHKITAGGGEGGAGGTTNMGDTGLNGGEVKLGLFTEVGAKSPRQAIDVKVDGIDSIRAGASGGSGGGRNNGSNTYGNGGAGGIPTFGSSMSRASAGASGSPPPNNRVAGGGGGGGTASTSGQNGGDGGIASGGGGAGHSHSTTKRTGGRGGNGIIRLWWW